MDLSIFDGDLRVYGQNSGESLPFAVNQDGKLHVVIDQPGQITTSGTALPVLAATRTTTYSMNVSWEDLGFDNLYVNSHSTDISQDDEDNSKFNIYATASYFISYNYNVESSGSTRPSYARVLRNGTEELIGSYKNVNTFPGEVITLVGSFMAELVEGDYITFQVSVGSVSVTLHAGGNINIVEMRAVQGEDGVDGVNGVDGTPGPQGPPGEEGSITVSDEGIVTVSGISDMSFGNNLEVSFPYPGKVLIDNNISLDNLTSSYLDMYDSTGTTSITSSWTDLIFDTVRQNNGAFTTTSTVITVEDTGNYVIVASINLASSSTTNRTECTSRLVLDNGSGYLEIPGTTANSYHRQVSYGSTTATISCILTLNAGETLKVQSRISAGNSSIITSAEGVSLTVFSLQGQKGDQGIQGEQGIPGSSGDSTMLIKEDGNYIPNTPHSILNFTGTPVTVTDIGSGEAEVNISHDVVFGSQFYESYDASQSSTTSTSYQQKLSLTTNNLIPSAKYRVAWSYEWQYRSDKRDILVRGQINDAITMFEHQEEPKDAGTDQWRSESGFYYHTATSIDPIDIDIDYASGDGDESSIRRTGIEFWRVT